MMRASRVLGATLGAFLVYAVQAWGGPWNLMPGDSLRVYLSDSCGGCRATYRKIVSDENLLAHVELVPVDLSGIGREACRKQLQKSAWRHLPEDIGCYLLVRDGRAFFRNHFGSVPAWSRGDDPLPFGEGVHTLEQLQAASAP